MAEIKGFDKNQTSTAIASVLVVVAAMMAILLFGENTGPSVKPQDEVTEPQTSEQTEPVSESDTTKEAVSESTTLPETTAPTTTTTQAMQYSVQSSIILQGDRAMEIYGVATNSLKSYATVISDFAKRVPKANVYVLLAPTSIEFYGPESYRTGSRSQAKGIGIAYGALTGENVKSVDALSEIQKHTSEYVYFRTDHHWTARGAYHAYTAFCKTAGLTPTKLEDHKAGRIDGFVGTMYTYTSAQVLADNPDYVEYFYPLSEATGMIYTDATMANGRSMKIITETVSNRNKYLAFLEGDNPLEKITTSNKNGKKIAIIKESYGNAFAPFLIDHYEEVYVIDPRKVEMDLKSFVFEQGITDVLFINYPFVPSNPTYRNSFDKMLAV